MFDRVFGAVGRALVVFAVCALAAGAVVDQPVLLSFVETGSMAPALSAGDGFVAVPAALSGSISTGDVVVFESETIGGGGLTTHRVVGETEQGYVTKGDANPFPDQDGGEPPVGEGRIVATALTVDGRVVALPHAGTVASAIQSATLPVQRRLAGLHGASATGPDLPTVVALLSIAGYLVDRLVADDGRDQGRERTHRRSAGVSTGVVVGGLAALVVVCATAAMVVPAGTHEYGVVSSEFSSADPTVIERGESTDLEYRVPNAGVVPVYGYVEPVGSGVAVTPRSTHVGARDSESVTVTLTAPTETGYYPTSVREWRYLAVLPQSVVETLYDVHPWAPIVAIDVLLGGVTVVVGRHTLGGSRIRTVSRPSTGQDPLRYLRRL